jgi:CRP-like cAMP-binding protein
MAKAPTPRNRLLSRLVAADSALLMPHLTPVDLPLRLRLEVPRKLIEHIYFPASGFVSVVANGRGSPQIEVGMIGSEGMTGLAVVLGTDRSPNETLVQNAGVGWRIAADELRTAMGQSVSLRDHLLLYAHAFLIQATQTAKANAQSKIDERLARWLLMAHDRLRTDELAITHEFLGVMLGVRRAGVTVALNLLEKAGLISTNRGSISILDRSGLKHAANGAYGISETEFNRVFG